ncbi:amidase [Ferrovibrio sp.]|uniref:amidase n=1 Tax=Ferrovibrio sp. TaxID=1917215 RepID=UPI0026141776|nr:amidase [Ferrovibrio sp.]
MDAITLLTDVAEGRQSAGSATADSLRRATASDPMLHAFITLSESAGPEARQLDAEGRQSRPLFGLPLAVKDLTDTAGLRTTHGSLIHRDHVPVQDDIVVTRARVAGAVILGKTNTPEFGFGALCANALCPSTANPYDLSLSSGGSSGGSAAAVAAGLVPAAFGTDFGGSVRTPAAFCGVVGFRPSAGHLPSTTRRLAWDAMPTIGFLTRSVRDAALLYDSLAGPDVRDPASLRLPPGKAASMRRIACSSDLGAAPISQAMAERFAAAIAALQRTGRIPLPAHPDCTGAMASFATLRAAHIHSNLSPLRERHGDLLSPTVRWNIGRGDSLTAAAYLQAEADRTVLYRRFIAFFDDFDILITPSAAILPFAVDGGEVCEIDGRPLDSLIDYLAITAIITLTGCPALSLPYWPPGEALPIGLQLIAAPGCDRSLFAFAAELESHADFGFRPPPLFMENFQ